MNTQINSNNSLLFIELDHCLQSSYPVYIKNRSGIYLNCNQHWAENFCLSSIDDVIGKSDNELLSNQDEIKIIHQNDEELLKSEKPSLYAEAITLENMQICSMLTYKMPFKDQDGNVCGILGTSISIEKKHLLSANARQANIPIPNGNATGLENKKISKRERECLYYLIRGMTAKEIARILNLSPRTIEFYIENMKKKFSCHNRIDLIAKAYDILQ